MRLSKIFRLRYSSAIHLVTVCQDIAYSLNKGVRTGTIIMHISKAFDLVQHEWLLTNIAATGVELRVVVWVKEFF
jgi:hypothetical protein